jgi:hypothetical protein
VIVAAFVRRDLSGCKDEVWSGRLRVFKGDEVNIPAQERGRRKVPEIVIVRATL